MGDIYSVDWVQIFQHPLLLASVLTASLQPSSPLSLCLFSSLFPPGSFLLPIWPFFQHKQLFLTVHLWGSRLMCVWGTLVLPTTHTVKRKHKHTLMFIRTHSPLCPSHIQPDIHQGAVVYNEVKLCPGCGHWGKLLSCHIFLLGPHRFSSFSRKKTLQTSLTEAINCSLWTWPMMLPHRLAEHTQSYVDLWNYSCIITWNSIDVQYQSKVSHWLEWKVCSNFWLILYMKSMLGWCEEK